LKLLRQDGLKIALENFGTGYSNFTYLKNFELDRLKIDQSFVRNLSMKNKGDVAIIKSIVQLARNFGLRKIAGKRTAFLSITHKLNSDRDSKFDVCQSR
jgi:EAL domain-containing protein (putative c-di-GMP-specific phosphodiesterase class I)